MRLAALAALIALAPAGDDFERGLEAYRAGKFRDALEAFTRAAKAAGDDAPAELLFDQALAALAAGDPYVAEASAERAAARGGPAFARARDFVRGNVSFARSEEAEKAIGSPQQPGAAPPSGGPPPAAPQAPPDPAAFDKAIALADQARDAWIAAATASGPDLPEARRNVERAVRRIEELKKKKEEAEKQKKDQEKQEQKQDKPNPDSQPSSRPESSPSDDKQQQEGKPDDKQNPKPDDKPGDKKDDKKDDKPEPKDEPKESPNGEPKPAAPGEQQGKVLSPEQVQRMLDKLDEKEKERQQLLRARSRLMKVPRDW